MPAVKCLTCGEHMHHHAPADLADLVHDHYRKGCSVRIRSGPGAHLDYRIARYYGTPLRPEV